MNEFLHCPRKRRVQEALFKESGGGHTATVLLGPNPKEYLSLLRKHVTIHPKQGRRMIHGYDLEEVATNGSDIYTYKSDISFASATSFIDLDLCSTLVSGKYLMYNLFEKQRKLHIKSRVFLVTFSQRDNTGKGGFKDICKAIAEMVGQELVTSKTKCELGVEYIVEPIVGYNIRIISYRDNTPMLSILIKY